MGSKDPPWEFSLGNGRVTHARELVSDDDVQSLQQLFELLPSYCEKTFGFPAGPAEAHSTLIARPPSASIEDKLPMGAFDASGQLVGFSDLILRFPEQDKCYIGYVLVEPSCQKEGLGSYLLDYSTKLAVSRQSQCTQAVTWLIETFGDEGENFLRRGGFVPSGTATSYEVNTVSSTRHEYIRVL